MARVTVAEVEEILETSATDAQITACITAANALVTEVVGSSSAITSTLKKEIERWLTAHLVISGIDGGQATEEAVGPVRARYSNLGQGLKSTRYGQQVLILDSTGGFAGLGGKSASLKAITSFS